MEYYQFYHPIPNTRFINHSCVLYISFITFYIFSRPTHCFISLHSLFLQKCGVWTRPNRPSFLKTRGVRTHLSLRTKIICCVRIISSSHALRSVPSDRFNKEIVNRKSKITLTISLRARICAFHQTSLKRKELRLTSCDK